MTDVACGIHALDRLIHDECVYCLRARIAARDREIGRLRAELSSNTGQLDACRRLLREAVAAWSHYRCVDGDAMALSRWLDDHQWHDEAARAAGGGDE
jgi:uncharacterized small protein (DUF1192 family)